MLTSMSVRTRIILLILLPLFAVALTVGYWAYSNTRNNAVENFDSSLLATASAILRDIALSEGDALSVSTRDLINDTSGGQVFYHVYAPDGVFVTGYATPPVSKVSDELQHLQFYEGIYKGSEVRVVKLRENMQIDGLRGVFSFTVWQTTALRESFVRRQTQQTFIVITVLTLSVALIIWAGVGVGLRPLTDLQEAIASRSTDDLTPIKRKVPIEVQGIVATLNTLLVQVSTSMQAKDDFISNAAHQLRNPVAGVMAMAEAVRSAPNSAAVLQRTSDLYEAAKQASNLANKLLNLERIKSIGDQLVRDPVSLLEICQHAKENTSHLTDNKTQVIIDRTKPDIVIAGDKLMLTEAVTNLIDNSIIHAGNGLSLIQVNCFSDTKWAYIEVCDDGKGIAEEEQSIVLERFGQLSPGAGSGLGLSIVQAVAKTHQGSLSLRTGKQGLCATIQLPID